MTDHCRQPKCQAEIIWAVHEVTGKRAPIDAAPAENGNIELMRDGISGEQRYRIVSKEDQRGSHYHLNHWVTCLDKPEKKGNR